jgi:hypothetical protein
VRFTDTATTVEASPPCRSVDEHTAECGSEEAPVVFGLVEAGDLDDFVEARNGYQEYNVLNGGGGREELHGTDFDTLIDGDVDGKLGAQGPGPDMLTGGHVSYEHRTDSIRVDLAAGRGGAAGEGDRLQGVLSVTGGQAGDVLAGGPNPGAGTGGMQQLDGGGGRDRLVGRGGDDTLAGGAGRDTLRGETDNDYLDGGPGNDRLFGGPGHDQLREGLDPSRNRAFGGPGRDIFALRGVASCGPGSDLIEPAFRDSVAGRDCERVEILLEDGETDATLYISPHPTKADGQALTFRVDCPRDGDAGPPDCGGTLKLTQASGAHRLLGRAAIGSQARRVRVDLTPAGRLLADRPRGVLTTAVVRGPAHFGATVWRIRLKAPSG